MILKDEREFAAQNTIDCLTVYCEEAVPDSERKTRRCIAALSKGDFLHAQQLRDGRHGEDQDSKSIQVGWEILPPGWWRDPRRRLHLESEFKNKEQARLFLERLEYLETFNPKEIYRSRFNDQASPYYAFVFTECVVAENPLEGNAIYVIAGLESWQRLLKLSKEALRQQYGHRIKRIVHRGNWKGRLEESLLSSS